MTLETYLKLAVKYRTYCQFAWVLEAFTVTRSKDTEQAPEVGKLIREPFGFFTFDEELVKVQLETSRKPSEPFLTLTDRITISQDWIPFLNGAPVETTVGRLLLNLIAIYEPFGTKLGYINKPFSPRAIEAIVAPLLHSDPPEGVKKDPAIIYADDNVRFAQSVVMLEQYAPIFAQSITRVGMMPPPGRREKRKELLKVYGDKLTDPIQSAKFNNELSAFDDAYLKLDPAYGMFMSGKVKNARLQSFMSQGGEANPFTGETTITPIIPSLEEGIPMDSAGFTAICNSIRYGSFARGAETVNGGVAAKAVQRATDSWRITPGDCGVTYGIDITPTEANYQYLSGRYLIIAGKPKLVETADDAKSYIGKEISARSSQFCRREGTQTCEVCAGKVLSKYPEGLAIPNMEVTGGVLADSLKKMHNTTISIATVQLSDIIS